MTLWTIFIAVLFFVIGFIFGALVLRHWYTREFTRRMQLFANDFVQSIVDRE